MDESGVSRLERRDEWVRTVGQISNQSDLEEESQLSGGTPLGIVRGIKECPARKILACFLLHSKDVSAYPSKLALFWLYSLST